MIDLQHIWWAYNFSNTIYIHRNRITNFLLKYKAGKIFLGIVLSPFLIALVLILYKMVQDPEFQKILAKVNAQKKISDYC